MIIKTIPTHANLHAKIMMVVLFELQFQNFINRKKKSNPGY